MKVFYCEICDKTSINKPRNKHNKTKSYDFMENYVINNYNYNDIVWDDVENIIHDNIIIHKNKLNEFKACVLCKIDDNIEIKIYKNSSDLNTVIPTFLPEYKVYDMGTLYIQTAGKMICKTIFENLRSKYDINCTPDMKIRNLTIKFISRYNNMTFRYQLEQPRRILESKLGKHMKNMTEEEQDNYNFLVCKHKLFNI